MHGLPPHFKLFGEGSARFIARHVELSDLANLPLIKFCVAISRAVGAGNPDQHLLRVVQRVAKYAGGMFHTGLAHLQANTYATLFSGTTKENSDHPVSL